MGVYLSASDGVERRGEEGDETAVRGFEGKRVSIMKDVFEGRRGGVSSSVRGKGRVDKRRERTGELDGI